MRTIMACLLLMATACGTVSADGTGSEPDGGEAGVACPTEDYSITGGTSNITCASIDLYTEARYTLAGDACTLTGGPCANPNAPAMCLSSRIVADGRVDSAGMCAYTQTWVEVSTAGDCMQTCVSDGLATYAALLRFAAYGAPTGP